MVMVTDQQDIRTLSMRNTPWLLKPVVVRARTIPVSLWFQKLPQDPYAATEPPEASREKKLLTEKKIKRCQQYGKSRNRLMSGSLRHEISPLTSLRPPHLPHLSFCPQAACSISPSTPPSLSHSSCCAPPSAAAPLPPPPVTVSTVPTFVLHLRYLCLYLS